MNNHPSQRDGRLAVACYKCTAGCIHLEYANVMFTFTQEQFLSFSEVIGTTRCTLPQEAMANFASPLVHRGLVYFVSKVGIAYCLDAATSTEKWRQRISGECWVSGCRRRCLLLHERRRNHCCENGRTSTKAITARCALRRITIVARCDRKNFSRCSRKSRNDQPNSEGDLS